jgi:hypothetical protein
MANVTRKRVKMRVDRFQLPTSFPNVETVWLRWSDLLVARMWILCKELCSSQTHIT